MAIENGVFVIKTENQKKSASISTSPSTNAEITANTINAVLSSSSSNNSTLSTSMEAKGIVSVEIATNTINAALQKNATLSASLSNDSAISASMGARGLPGRGIVSVEKTGSVGLVDTYTIYYTDGTTSTFEITNGKGGEGGTQDYEQLENIPSINGVALVGNKTTEDLLIETDADKNYHHNQTTASDTWVIIHNLNKYPSVNVINSAGDEVVGDIIYNDINQVTIKFKGSFKGSATLN